MKKIIITLLLVLIFGNLYSQKITGKVYDDSTKLPIPEVSIYLNGTTYNTKTDINGKFELNFSNIINTDLVISRVGYKMISIPNPYDGIPEKIYLTPKSIFDVVVIEADKINKKGPSRKQMLKIFKTSFIGESFSAKTCVIQNENDITLYYNSENYQLKAEAENPIIVHNKYLGYKVSFLLSDFCVQYSSNLPSRKIISTLYKGTIAFNDLSNNNKSIDEKRKSVYKDSRNFYFKNLAYNTLDKSAFLMYIDEKRIMEGDDYFVNDSLSIKHITIRPHQIRHVGSVSIPDGKIALAKWFVFDRDMDISNIIFLTNKFYIDQFGNTYSIDEKRKIKAEDRLIILGKMGEQRIGDALPIDYDPIM
ncbi:MAG: carboxypeptidase-like regulatory domain-containing protein [Prevotella sp.]|jgi:hypothetical protein|nr:carboxypeptidase-like regulatory domain-containing protein [Prevotella sp.]